MPAGVDALVETVIVDEPEVAMDAGLNDAEAPAGRPPVTLNATLPENPAPGVTVTVYAALTPAVTDCDDGESESVKSATVMVRVAAALVSPPLSVTVSDAVRVPGVEYVTVGF